MLVGIESIKLIVIIVAVILVNVMKLLNKKQLLINYCALNQMHR